MARSLPSLKSLRRPRTAQNRRLSGERNTELKRRLVFETLERRMVFAAESFEAGSYIIDMGQSTQTVANSLKPYGLIYDLVTNYKVPVQWAIDPAKASFGFDTNSPVPIDFTATITSGSKDYRAGSFIIDQDLITPTVLTVINAWKAQGVVVDQLAAPLTTEIYGQISSFPKAVLDLQNGKIAAPFYTNAGIPTTSYRLGNPSNLNTCDDIYIMPHADPQLWTDAWKVNLLKFVDQDGGGLWAGCHAISALEALTVTESGQRLNFLSNDLVPWTNHDDGTPPYDYNPAAANDPVMQIMNRLDAATLNGSEQIAVPTVAGWRNTTTVAVFDDNHPSNPAGGTSPFNKAAVVAYGHAYGDPTNGLVMFEASHSIAGTSTANVAAQRAFFNFLLTNGINKAPAPTVTAPAVVAGQTSTLSATISGGSGTFTYQWVSTNGGIFSQPAGTWTTGSPAISTQYLMTSPDDTVKLLITDSCGRQSTWYESFALDPPTLDLDFNDSTTATGADYKGYFTGNSSVVPAADLDTTITAGGTTIQSARIDLTNRLDGTAETLLIDEGLAADYGIVVQSDGDGGFLLSGEATLAQYMAVIATLQYVNSLPFPSTPDRVIEVVVNDGSQDSNKAVSRLSYIGGTVATVNKYLYLSDPARGMDRIDPVATGDNTTSSVGFNPVVSSNSSGLAVWTNRSRKNIEYRAWNQSSYGPQGTTVVDGGSYNTMASAASSIRNEAIVVGVTTDKRVSGSIWNGTAWTPIRINVGGNLVQRLGTTTAAPWWGADVAYEKTSGRAMLVWNTGSTLNYSLWNGSSWTPASTITAYTGAEPRQIRLAANPLAGSNEMVMVVTSFSTTAGSTEVDRALVWNGSSWGNQIQLDSNTGHNFTDTAVAYERQTGRAMVTYASGTGGNVGYQIWNGTSWSAAATVAPPASGISGYAQWTVLATDPNSNRIVMGVETSGKDAWVNVWNGSSWGASTLGITDGVDQNNNLGIAVTFESTSGEALAVYQNDLAGTEMQFRTWNSTTGWSAGTNFGNLSSEDTEAITLTSNPYSDQIMLMVNDADKVVRSVLWGGSSFGSFTTLETNSNVTTGQPFEFIWDSYLPGAVTTQNNWTQTAPMVSPFVMPSGGLIKATAYIEVTSGTFPASPKLGIALDHEQDPFYSLPGPPTVTSLGANRYKLEWSGVLPANETVPAGSQIDMIVQAFETGYSFNLLFDSATYPSQLQLETVTAITIDSAAVYTAAYPGGSPITTAVAGTPVYVRFTVADPFGAYDITGADLLIKDSLGSTVLPTVSLNDLNVVTSTAGSKTYEYLWTPPSQDTFTLTITAHEGTEGVIAVADRTLVVTAAPDLVIVKSDDNLTIGAGGTIAYTLNYSNQGLGNATGVVISEFLPVGSTFNAAASSPGWVAIASNEYQYTVGSLAAGASGSVLFAVTVPSTIPASLEELLNAVSITDDGTNGPDPNTTNNRDEETTPINAVPDLVITKSDGGVSTLPGGIVLYQITYRNVGTQDAVGVLIEELLPPNTTFNSAFSFGEWDTEGAGRYSVLIGDLPAGASGTVTFAVNVEDPLPGGVTQISNTADIEDSGAGGPDPTPANNSSTDTTPITIGAPSADLQVSKTNNLTSVTPGSLISYTVTVTNAGPNAVTGASFTDVIPNSLTGVSYVTAVSSGASVTPGAGSGNSISGQLNLPVGGTVTYTVSGTLNAEATGSLTNVATVTPPSGVVDPNTGNNTAIDQDPIVPISDLSLTKNYTYTDLDGSGSLTAGDPIVFVLTVTNSGPHTAQNVSVSDLLPSGYQFVSSDAAANGYTYSQGTGLWTIGAIGATAPNNVVVLQISAIVSPGGIYTNIADIASSDSFDPDSTPGNRVPAEDDYATITPPVQKKSDLAVTKAVVQSTDPDSNGILSIGDRVTFTITLGNYGPDAATGVLIADALPLGYSFVSATSTAGTTYNNGTGVWNVGAIDVLATKTLTIVATILGGQTFSAYTNTASVSASDNYDPNPSNNSASADPPIADLSLTKTVGFAEGGDVDENGTPSTDDVLVFTITVSNAGPDFASDVSVLDQLPTGFAYESDDSGGDYDPLTGIWSVGAIAPGDSRVLRLEASILATGTYTNTAQVSATNQFDPDSKPNNSLAGEDDQASVTVVPNATAQPPVAVNDSKLQNPAGPVTLSVVGNDSDPNFDLNVATVDLDPSTAGRQTTFVAAGQGTWAVDDLGNVTFTPLPTFTLDPTPIPYRISDAGGRVSNSATITIDYVPRAQDDSSSGNVAGTPVTLEVLTNDTTGDTVVPSTVQIVGTNTPGSPLVVFGEGTWSVNLTTGAITFTPVSGFTGDPTPIRYTVNDNDGNVSNPALVTIDYDPPIPTADLQITKTDNLATAIPGTTLTYVIVVTNAGPFDVVGAVVNDTLPDDLLNPTWTVTYSAGSSGSVAAGANSISGVLVNLLSGGTATFTVTATIDPAATGAISNTATVAPPAGITDPNPNNNTATDPTTLTPRGDLSITKTDGLLTNVPGGSVVYTIVVNNAGPSFASSARVVDNLPGLLLSPTWTAIYVGAGSTGATSGSGNIDQLIDLAPGGTAVFTVSGTLSAAASGTISNTATVTAGSGFTDPVPGNNSATDTTDIVIITDLAITKTDFQTSDVPGTSITYTIVVTNNGPANISGALVNDTFAAQILSPTWTAVYSAGSSGSASGSGSIANLSINLLNGGTATFTVTGTIASSATGTLTNTATVAPPAGVIDTNTTNNSATDTTDLTPQGDLSITKTDGQTDAIPGTTTSYTIAVSNAGVSDVTGALVNDPFPAALTGVTWVATYGVGANGPAGGSGSLVNVPVNLPAGTVATFIVSGTIASTATGTLTNTATVTAPAGFTDTNGGNNSATDNTNLTPQGDLSITKTDGLLTVADNTSITYTIVVTNNGPSFVTGATVADTFPVEFTGATWNAVYSGSGASGPASGSGNISASVNLPSGGTATFTVTGTVVTSGLNATLSNTATVTAPGGFTDPTPENDSATDTTGVTVTGFDLAITKTDNQTIANPGSAITYTIVVTNSGPGVASNVAISDSFPVEIVSPIWDVDYAGGASGSITSGTDNLLLTSVIMGPGSIITITVTGTISASATGTLSNTALVTAPNDLNPSDNSATDDTDIRTSADLRVTKSNVTTPIVPGGNVIYTITVFNDGPSDVTGATVQDFLPAGATFVSSTAPGLTYDSGTNTLNYTTGTINSGSSTTFTVTLAVASTLTGNLTNTVTVTPPVGVVDPDPSDNTATDNDPLDPTGDLQIVKTASTPTVIPGNQVTYTIIVTNAGPSFVNDAVVADTFPGVLSGATWSAIYVGAGANGPASGSGNLNALVDLPSGGTATFTVTTTLSAAATGSLVNTATVTAPAGFTDPTPANNSSQDTRPITPTGDLSVTKTDGNAFSSAGSAITYTIVVTNNGPSDVTGAIVNDALPAAIKDAAWSVSYSAGSSGSVAGGTGSISGVSVNLLAGGTATFTVSGTIDGSASGTLANTASVQVPPGFTDTNPGNNADTDNTTLTQSGDLYITKTDGNTSAVPGTALSYTIQVGNTGPSDAIGATLTDILPAALQNATWTASYSAGSSGPATGSGSLNGVLVNLLSGGMATIIVSGTLSPTASGTLSNTANIAPPSGFADTDNTNNSATDTTSIDTSVDLRIVKTNFVNSLVPGRNTIYTITVTNDGVGPVTGAVVTDVLPAGTTYVTATGGASYVASTNTINFTTGTLAAGEAISFTVTVSIAPELTGTLVNAATVAPPSGLTDSNPGNNTSTDSDPLVPTADLRITKTNFGSTVIPGTETSYVVTVFNDGPSTLNGATVTDVLPTGVTFVSSLGGATYDSLTNTVSYTSGVLATGGSASFTITVLVAPSLTGTLTNIATVSPPAGVTDPTPSNNSATDADPLIPTADLKISKSNNVASLSPGSPTTYVLSVFNDGPSTVTGAVVTDFLPIGLTFVSATNGATYNAANNSVTFVTPTLTSGASAGFSFVALVDPAAFGTITNTASVAPPQGVIDPHPTDNSASDTDPLVATVDLSLTKDNGVTTLSPGGLTTYTVIVTNGGPSTMTGAVVTDVLPANVTFVSATGDSAYFSSTRTVRYATGTLATGEFDSFSITVMVNGDATGSVSNTATVAPPTGYIELDPDNNSATDTDPLDASVDLRLTKTNGVTALIPGTQTTYTITVFNDGPSTITGASVVDALPTGLTFVTGSAGVNHNAGTVSFLTGTLASGASQSFTFTVLVGATVSGSLTNTATVTAPAGFPETDPSDNSASDTDPLNPTVDMRIVKTNGTIGLIPGAQSTYTITVTNGGPSTITGASIVDVLPAGLTFVSASGGASHSAGTINYTTGTLVSGASESFAITVLVGATVTGNIANTATVTVPGGFTESNPTDNSSTDTDPTSPTVDLRVSKTNNVNTLIPGTSATYTITVTNAGPSTVTGATVADILPGGLTFVSGSAGVSHSGGTVNYTTGTLTSGASETFTFVVSVGAAATGSIVNTVTVAPPSGFTESSPFDNSATDTDPLIPTVDLSITKSNGVSQLIPGTQTTYTINVANAGPSTVTGASVVDVLPAGLTFVSATGGATHSAGTVSYTTGTLASGGTTSFTITVLVSAAFTGSVTNTATVNPPSGVTESTPGNNSSTDSDTLVPTVDLRLTKSNGVNSLVPGTQTTYTINVANFGPSTLTGATVTDVLPAGLTFVSATGGATHNAGTISYTTGTLASGESTSFTITVLVGAAFTGSVANTATVSPPNGVTESTPGDNTATDTDTLVPTANLGISKANGVNSLVPGTQTTYTFNVSNAGPSTITGASVTDILPAGLTFVSATGGATHSGSTVSYTTGTLATGGSESFTVTVLVDAAATTSIANTVTITPPSGVTDPTPGNNSSTDTDTLIPTVDLVTTKTNSTTVMFPGTNTTYTITLTNLGPSTVTGATVTDVLPSGLSYVSATGNTSYNTGTNTVTFTAGTLASGGTTSFTVTALVNPGATGSLSNSATATPPSGVTESTPGNNTATDTDSLSASGDLSITITDGSEVYRENGFAVYTIVVSNDGLGAAPGTLVQAALPAGATGGTWTATYTTGSTGAASGSGAIDQTITLLPGGVATYTYTVAIGAGTSGKLVTEARVTPPTGMIDTNASNNSDTDTDKLPLVITGTEVGCLSAPFITVIDPYTGAIRTQFNLFEPNYRGGVRVALGDVDGDGIDEIIAAPGAGRLGEILVFRLDGTPMPAYRTVPFGTSYKSGVEIAVGDVDGDGIDDIVASAARGPGDVRVFRVTPGAADPVPDTPFRSFRAFNSKFKGGATVAVADMGTFSNGSTIDRNTQDGRSEIIVGSGTGMAPRVLVYDVSGSPTVIDSFAPMTSTPKFRNGVSVSAGRFNADAIPDVIVSAGRSGGTVFEVYDGKVGTDTNALLERDAIFADIANATSPLFSVGIDLDGDNQIDEMFNSQGNNGTRPYPGIRYTEADGDLLGTISSLNFSQRIAASPPRKSDTLVTTPTGLLIEDVVVGTGAVPQFGQSVTIHYIASYQNGTVLQNTHLTGVPLNFNLSNTQVMAGLNEAVATMRVGGRRQVIIPESLTVGSIPSGLPANTPLVFDIELLSVGL